MAAVLRSSGRRDVQIGSLDGHVARRALDITKHQTAAAKRSAR